MKYRNNSDRDLAVVGLGVVPAGHIVECPFEINNANFCKVDELESKPRPITNRPKE